MADAGEIPPFLERVPDLLKAMDGVSGDGIPDDLKGPARGAWLRERKTESVARVVV
jgi:hypothetical protein